MFSRRSTHVESLRGSIPPEKSSKRGFLNLDLVNYAPNQDHSSLRFGSLCISFFSEDILRLLFSRYLYLPRVEKSVSR